MPALLQEFVEHGEISMNYTPRQLTSQFHWRVEPQFIAVAVSKVPCIVAVNSGHLQILASKDSNVTSALWYATYVM